MRSTWSSFNRVPQDTPSNTSSITILSPIYSQPSSNLQSPLFQASDTISARDVYTYCPWNLSSLFNKVEKINWSPKREVKSFTEYYRLQRFSTDTDQILWICQMVFNSRSVQFCHYNFFSWNVSLVDQTHCVECTSPRPITDVQQSTRVIEHRGIHMRWFSWPNPRWLKFVGCWYIPRQWNVNFVRKYFLLG